MPKASPQAAIVYGPRLVDHDLAVTRIAGHALRQEHAEEALAREPRPAGQDQCGGMSDRVQEIRLDHDHRAALTRLGAPSPVPGGDVEPTVPDGRVQPSPSPAR